MKIRNRVNITGDIVDAVDADLAGQRVLTTKVGRTIDCNVVVIFDVEAGDFEGASDGVGAVFLHMEGREGEKK